MVASVASHAGGRGRRPLPVRRGAIGLALVLVTAAAPSAGAAEIRVLASTALRPALEELAPAFEHRTGHRLHFAWGPSSGPSPDAIASRLARGERADVVAMIGAAMDSAPTRDAIVPGTRVDVADSFLGLAVAPGLPRPAIRTGQELKDALLGARRVAISTGVSGRYLLELFQQLGIPEQMAPRLVHVAAPRLVGQALRDGEADLGMQQMSELLAVPGIQLVGRLPDSTQQATTIAMAVVAHADAAAEGQAWIAHVSTPASLAVLEKWGFAPRR